jgi:DNA-binding GntR family transcriptional regulator
MARLLPLERAPLRSRIYSVVREQVIAGQLGAGAPVRDVELAKALGASRTPVREALIQLAAEGLLESHVGRGFRVPALLRSEVEEAQPLIATLEPLALANSLPCTKTQQRELERLAVRMEGTGADAAALHALDTRWHRSLLSRCPNARLLRYVEELRDVLRRYELAYLHGVEGLPLSVTEHRGIAEAFAEGERGLAVERLGRHWERSKNELLAIVPKDLDS